MSQYRRSFINYFSLGYDARIGFGFDKKRSGKRCLNKCIYFWEGCKKNCCTKTFPLNSFINSFQVIDFDSKKKLTEDNSNSEGVAVQETNKQDHLDNFTKRKSIVYFKSRGSTLEGLKQIETENCN
jgi:hypothetical protein